MKSKEIQIGAEYRYVGDGRMKGSKVLVVKVWANHRKDPDSARGVGSGLYTATEDDLIEVKEWIPSEGRFTWVSSDASIDDLEKV